MAKYYYKTKPQYEKNLDFSRKEGAKENLSSAYLDDKPSHRSRRRGPLSMGLVYGL
jgi:hypothetical protein